MRLFYYTLAIVLSFTACKQTTSTNNSTATKTNVVYELKKASDVEWSYLNPARKDKAPMAGTLWGDRNGTDATGFLLKPSDGFQSPPHIHNVSYRGIVIEGVFHNDDPTSSNLWMTPGSFWTQPKGHVHITAAKGMSSLAYIEIEKGPYLVLPEEEAFDSGERPVNVDETNIVWLGASDMKWIDQEDGKNNGAKIAVLWGNSKKNALYGSLIKLPAGYKGKLYTHSSTFRAVVIKGKPFYSANGSQIDALDRGSYFASAGEGVHEITSSNEETILYVRTDGKYEVTN